MVMVLLFLGVCTDQVIGFEITNRDLLLTAIDLSSMNANMLQRQIMYHYLVWSRNNRYKTALNKKRK